MKKLITGILIFVSTLIYSQSNVVTDSVNLRIYNAGRFNIKELKINIDGNKYVFNDIWKKKYSDFIKIPYIWSNNEIETTVIVKRMFKYDQWFTQISIPIDHIGEKKIENGFCTLELKTQLKKKKLTVEQNLIKIDK